ncbi:MAG: serine/threonine-protein kinase [Planctomycetota bacterium]|nr:serine/threonine-protein kinase [Planctomycetota bacterium]
MQAGQVFQEKYRIEREIGRGSFGVVYLAQEIESFAWRAIKVLLPWARGMPAMKHRLKREAKLTRMLRSPNAVRIHDTGETHEGDFYVVMEYLRGQELNETLRQEGKLSYDRALNITRQVLLALQEAHALGVIHRDMKSHNIYICNTPEARDQVKVLDFGIAKVAGTDDGSGLMETTRLTDPGGILGTPEYMSPEQCRGEVLHPASDFYSLAIVTYEMLTGRVPFSDPNPVRVMMMQNSNPLPPLPDKLANTPLGRAVNKALSKDERDRFQNAAEFLAALEQQAEPIPASPAAGRPTALPAATEAPRLISRAGAVRNDGALHRLRASWSRYAFAIGIGVLLIVLWLAVTYL